MDIPLSTIILGELLFVLSVLLAFFVKRHIRQKKIITKLMEKLHHSAGTQAGESFYDQNRAPSSQPDIPEYFERSINDALERFKKFTGNSQPELNKEHPFSGKIAALRHLYLSTEQELFAERGITHAGWGTLERRLAEIVQWSDQSASQHQKVIDDLQRQLRARADEIQRHQAKNAHLLKRLENLRNEQHSLEHLNTKNSALIEHLQDALQRLKSATAAPPKDEGPSFSFPLSDHFIEKFGEANAAESHNLRALLHEIKTTPSALFNPAQQKRIESQVNALEIELLKSDRHINDLKQQLKEAKSQITNYALMSRDNNATGNMESLYRNVMQKVSSTNQEDPDTIIAEIKNLQSSNKVQYTTISNLEDEISTLKNSISTDDSADINKEKEKEIQRLEQLVRECQGCIVILEEEVDNLYAQLQEQESQINQLPDEPLIDTKTPSSSFEDVEYLVQELQKTATNYQHVYAINTILLEFLQCHNFELLVNLLLEFINAFNLPAAIYIDSAAGHLEHIPEHLFTTLHRSQLHAPDTQESLLHLDDGTLFNYPNVRAIIRTDNQVQTSAILDTNFQMVIAAANERLNDLTHYLQETKILESDALITLQIRDTLNNLNIRYAFQVDENRKTLDHFLAELRRAYSLLKLTGPGAIVLDNAVNEFEMRMALLLESGEAIDKEISLLVEKMN